MKAIKGELQALKKLQKQFVQEKSKLEKQAFEQKKQSALTQGKAPPLSHDDIQLFHQTLRGVTPLADTNRIDKKAVPLKNPEFYRAKREQAEGEPHLLTPKRTKAPATLPVKPSQIQLQNEHTYLAAGMGKDVLRKLKQLVWSVEATLDLHGATLAQATVRFDRFVTTCFEHNVKCFMIIHGKGYGSKDGKTVLKQRVISWLRDLDHIAAFMPAPDNMGGEGALIILSKGSSSNKGHLYVESSF